MKVQMWIKRSQGRIAIARALGLCALALLWVWGCSPTTVAVVPKTAPQQAPEYGKFLVYRVGDGKVWTFQGTNGPHQIPYMVGETYLPSRYPFGQEDYNILHIGDGSDNPEQYFYYRDFNLFGNTRFQRGPSDNPEAVVVGDQLKLYFTNQPFQLSSTSPFPTYEGFFYNLDEVPDTPLPPSDPSIVYIQLNSFTQLGFQHGYTTMDGDTVDVDVLAFEVPQDYTIVHFRIIAHQLQLARHVSFLLSIIDTNRATVLAQSHAGLDSFTFNDPEIGYNFPRAGVYYLMLQDLNHNKFPPNPDNAAFTTNSNYMLICESDQAPAIYESFIRRGDLQPARSGNPNLDGGKTFEPDDVKTPIEDLFPDCDGIPNTGDEGDWGVDEKCGSFVGNNGVQDGNMQWWEIDNRTNLDDGEYFTAKDTNVRSVGWEAPSMIEAPEEDRLWMWINGGDAIYQLQSLDGLEGLNWDLSNLLSDRPAVRAGRNGDPDSPVVSSGVYGYCETPANSLDVQLVDVCTVKGQPIGCRGYPHTIGVTQGQDGVLETVPQGDDLDPAQNAITTGPDGIINTFFLPSHIHYGAPYHTVEVTVPAGGPANPDVLCADSVPAANDRDAYLLGDDQWAPALTATPAEYWRKHNCVFFQIGDNLNKCAMGIPDTVAVRPDSRGNLHTVTELLLGDDELCHEGDQVGICPGPNGKFDWGEIYQPLQGDDELCVQLDPVLQSNEVAICPGPNGTLETPIIDLFVPINDGGIGSPTPGDVCCNPAEVVPSCSTPRGFPTCCSAICPGVDHWLQTLYVLYFSDISVFFPPAQPLVFSKGDPFTDFDDEMCVIGGQIALCPGENNYFQSYPLNRQQPVKRYETYEDLLAQFTGLPNDCYSLEEESLKSYFSDIPQKVFTLFRSEGVMFDDEIRWDQFHHEYYISTGENGINQTCLVPGDEQLIPHLRGLPNQPVILPGPNGVLDTPALQDELVRIPLNGHDQYKIGTGTDGIANSFPMGDDRMEIFLGTGQADWPCVAAGTNGVADTTAQGNDTQLYRPGEVTGFDAYQVGYPDVVREGDQLYLFYTGLGWGQVPPKTHRKDTASLNLLGECDRAGLDHLWGNRDVEYKVAWQTNPIAIVTTIHERTLVASDGSPRYRFLHALDNNQGVLLVPRIGLATSTVQRIEADPTDWDKHLKPVVDVGEVCSKALDLPISLPLSLSSLPGLEGAANYNGTYSSDTLIYHEQSNGQPIFVMAFSGLASFADPEGDDRNLGNQESFNYNLALARSLNGLRWDVAYDIGNLMIAGSALDTLMSGMSAPQYRNPTLARGQGDSYNVFFEQFLTIMGGAPGLSGAQFGADSQGWIGFGVRGGAVNPNTCLGLAGSPSLEQQDSRQALLGGIVIAVPLLIGVGWRLLRRKPLQA